MRALIHQATFGAAMLSMDSASAKELEKIQCAICLSTIYNFATIKCKHSFCMQCIQTWIDRKPTCPVCVAPCTTKQITQSIMSDDMIAILVDQFGSPDDRREYVKRKTQHMTINFKQSISMHVDTLTLCVEWCLRLVIFLGLYGLFLGLITACLYALHTKDDYAAYVKIVHMVVQAITDAFKLPWNFLVDTVQWCSHWLQPRCNGEPFSDMLVGIFLALLLFVICLDP